MIIILILGKLESHHKSRDFRIPVCWWLGVNYYNTIIVSIITLYDTIILIILLIISLVIGFRYPVYVSQCADRSTCTQGNHQQIGVRLFFYYFYFYGLYDLYQDYMRLYCDYSDYVFAKTLMIIRDNYIISEMTIISPITQRLFHLLFSAYIIAIICIISR